MSINPGTEEGRSITASPSKAQLWAAWTLSGLCSFFLLFDGLGKIAKIPQVMEACEQLGIPANVVPSIGMVLVVCTLIYMIPWTSVLGAILLTGYLGGAIATHVRMNGPAFPVVFATIIGMMVWGGLYLRDHRIRALIPFRG